MAKIVNKEYEFEVTYDDSPEAKQELYERMLYWHVEKHAFSGEDIWQSDMITNGAPEILTDIAEQVFKFKVNRKGWSRI